MIKGKDGWMKPRAWHYDAEIEKWNEIAESGGALKEWDALIVETFVPQGACFACELFINYDNPSMMCDGCPFTFLSAIKVAPCEYKGSLYYNFNHKNGEYVGQRPDQRRKAEARRKMYAIAIAQLFIDNYPGGGGA